MLNLRTLLTLTAALGLFACSSGGGSSGGNPQPQPTPSLQAIAEILFPSSAAAVDSDTMTVVGTASANEEITAVRVNGFGAASSNDFASWRTSVPLEPGQNTLVVEVQGTDGKVAKNVTSVTVRRGNGLFSNPDDLVRDPQTGALYVLDTRLGRIIQVEAGGQQRTRVAERGFKDGIWQVIAIDAPRGLIYAAASGVLHKVDLATEAVTVVSDASTGSGTAIQSPLGLAVSADGKSVYMSNYPAGIMRIDVATGNRTVIATRTSSPAMNVPRGMCLDAAANRLLIVDNGADKVFALSLTTNKKTVISEDSDPGPDLANPWRIRIGATNAVALLTDYGLRALVVVDLKTGNRTVVSDANTGSGDPLVNPGGLALDIANDKALVCDRTERKVVAIDLRTLNLGNRTVYTEAGIGSGDRMTGSLQRFSISDDGKEMYLSDTSTTMWAVDTQTGNRRVLSRTGTDPVGKGPDFALIYSSVVRNGTLYVGDYSSQSIFVVDRETGDRTVISQSGNLNGKTRQPVGDGPDLGRVRCLIASDREDEVFVVNDDRAMFRISTTDGKRTQVFDNDANNPKIKATVVGGTFGTNGELYVATTSQDPAIYEVDLIQGKATAIAGTKIGTGPAFSGQSLTMDSRGRLLTKNSSGDFDVLAIDPATGNREAISGFERGTGPELPGGAWLAGDHRRLFLYSTYGRSGADDRPGQRRSGADQSVDPARLLPLQHIAGCW